MTSEYLNDKIGFSNAANADAYNGFKTGNLYQLPVWLRLEDDYGNVDYDITQVSISYNAVKESGWSDFIVADISSNSVDILIEDGKIKDYAKNELEIVDQEVNIDIDIPTNYMDEADAQIDIKQLEDDKNSSTGNV